MRGRCCRSCEVVLVSLLDGATPLFVACARIRVCVGKVEAFTWLMLDQCLPLWGPTLPPSSTIRETLNVQAYEDIDQKIWPIRTCW